MEPIPFKQLPSELQKTITSSDTNVVIATIASKFKLDEEKEADLGYLNTRLLLGLLPRNEFEETLSETLSVPKEISSSLAEELDMKVFAKVRTELDTLYKNNNVKNKPSATLPPPPPPPPGARRSIPIRDLRTLPNTQNQTVAPSVSYRPVQPAPPIALSKQAASPTLAPSPSLSSSSSLVQKKPELPSFSKPVPMPPANLPVSQPPTPKASPFNTPQMLTGVQKIPPITTPQSLKPITDTGPIGDILSAKLTGTIQATNNEHIPNTSQSRGYGSVDPYRELPE